MIITFPCSQADSINSIVKAAGIEVEPYWPALFAKLFAKKDIGDLITNVGAGEWWLGAAARGAVVVVVRLQQRCSLLPRPQEPFRMQLGCV
jgi:hypothetical protein